MKIYDYVDNVTRVETREWKAVSDIFPGIFIKFSKTLQPTYESLEDQLVQVIGQNEPDLDQQPDRIYDA